MTTAFLSVYVTAGLGEEADKIAQAVIEEKLAACANIIPGVKSVYRWQGKLEQAQEYALILKTTADKFDALQKRIKEIHSYQCPCIVATPIVAGNQEFFDWIAESLN